MEGHQAPHGFNPFLVLEFAQIPSKLTMERLKEVRNGLLLKYHPDKAPLDSSASERVQREEKTKAINKAYELLEARILDPKDPLGGE